MTFQDGVRIEIDPEQLTALLRELKAVQPKIATGMRREVRKAGAMVRDVAVEEVLAYPQAKYSTGMREKLAGSIAVRIVSSPNSRRQGVDIVSTGRLLPKNKRVLVKAMNRKVFRHPVYEGRAGTGQVKFVEQAGARYFRPSTLASAKALMNARIRVVMDDALAALAS